MSPPGARAPARLRVATMFTGAGAIDYGCVRARRATRGARRRARNATERRTPRDDDGFRSTRDVDDARRALERAIADDGATTARADAKRARDGAARGRRGTRD